MPQAIAPMPFHIQLEGAPCSLVGKSQARKPSSANASPPRTRSDIDTGPILALARIASVTVAVAGRVAVSAGGAVGAVMAVQAGSLMTAYHEHTTPAGATPPLPLACGTVRTIEPVSAGR
ncbi:hypothetical protein BLA6863_01200 [Burkholderia lata]|uniref:Uncharacterized protein n=1 Tax=Burkholderia lata (strain ATCC 17760 / DSM 23089 / LMG 22485 / NCIMB 9086 / R18194 / 383) TaxID=482957 RepID=A0A6P2IFV3_BURL3|nr:hypothetical protein BLA6863_01200 [Burkholderia lata]